MASPSRLGERYRILHPIARGGMGQVYEALDEKLGRRVAIKVLLDELAQDPTCKERFRREAHAVAATSHPSLVAVYDLSLESAPAFLVMELLEGPSLSTLLNDEGRLPWPRAARLMIQVLDALQCLHDAGVVHRDLKPANVLVVGQGERELAKVIDLGVAQLVTGQAYQRLTHSGAIVGTPAFMAPEQLAGERVGPAADLWAVGTLLFTSLTGQRPHASRDLSSLLESMHGGPPPSVRALAPDVPESLEHIVRALLEKFPEDRPTSARAAADALRDVLSGVAVVAPAPSSKALSSKAALVAPRAPLGSSKPSMRSEPTLSQRTQTLARTHWASLLAAVLAGLGLIATCLVGAGLAYLYQPTDWDHLPPPTTIMMRCSGPPPRDEPALSASLLGCIDLGPRAVGSTIAQLRVEADAAGRVVSVQRLEEHGTPEEMACLERTLFAASFQPSYHPTTFVFITATQ